MLKRCFFITLFFILGGVHAIAQNREEEATLKAAFVYNFTKYIDWFSDENNFIIGVIGTSPVYDALQEIAKTKTVKGKRILVRLFNKPEEITTCNILFISANVPYSLSSILDKTNKGTLTISEENGFAEQGTAFNFIVVRDKLKFEANVKSINAAGLKASSQLLKLAKIVD